MNLRTVWRSSLCVSLRTAGGTLMESAWAVKCTMSRLALAFLLFSRTFCVEANCAVCVGFLSRLYGSLTSTHRDLTPALVEEELLQACTTAQGKEARLCYYLGASSDAPARVIASVSRPLASHVPVEKICQRLSSSDAQICQLKYEPQLKDLSSDGLKKLKVMELRNILASWGEECQACLEKQEFVRLIQEKAPLHAHNMEL